MLPLLHAEGVADDLPGEFRDKDGTRRVRKNGTQLLCRIFGFARVKKIGPQCGVDVIDLPQNRVDRGDIPLVFPSNDHIASKKMSPLCGLAIIVYFASGILTAAFSSADASSAGAPSSALRGATRSGRESPAIL